jgi:hypothetical protein
LQAAMTEYDFNFERTLGIEDLSLIGDRINTGENQLYVFPNPAANMITIQYAIPTPDACELRITDVTGRIVLVKKMEYNSNKEQIDISKLNSGVYLLTLYENNTPKANTKLVKE